MLGFHWPSVKFPGVGRHFCFPLLVGELFDMLFRLCLILDLAFLMSCWPFLVFGHDGGLSCFLGFPSSCFWYGVEPLGGRLGLGPPFGDKLHFCSFAKGFYFRRPSVYVWGGFLMGFCMSGSVLFLAFAGLG